MGDPAQQLCDALAHVNLRVVETGEQLRYDACGVVARALAGIVGDCSRL